MCEVVVVCGGDVVDKCVMMRMIAMEYMCLPTAVVHSNSALAPDTVAKAAHTSPAIMQKSTPSHLHHPLVRYSCYYLTRNSLTYTAPVMVADASLGLDITAVGAMTSIFPIAYGMSKFVSGVLGARSSPQILLAGGLMATAVVNIMFGFGTSLIWFCSFWAMNGILQGLGGPCCARILTSWFATKERGTYWGMWNIAHNLGGFAAPILAGTAARTYGWQWGMWAPGICGIVIGLLVLLAVRDSPEAIGYTPVEAAPVAAPPKGGSGGDKADDGKESLLSLLVNNVLKNPYIWAMAFTYFFIYVIRQGVTSWFVFYLVKVRGVGW